MSYCTIEQVRNRNTNLLNTDVPDARIEDAIAMSESIVEGMLSRRYTLPLSEVPSNISAITADLAASALIGEIVGNKGENGEPTQAVYLRTNAMEILQMVEDGRLSLNLSTTDSQGAQARCSTYYHRSRFARWDPTRPETYRRR